MITVVTVPPTEPGSMSPASRWVRAPGVELLGEYQGGGWTDPHYLVRRGDGQFAKLSGLLYHLLLESNVPRTAAELHAAVAAGRDVSVSDVEQMLSSQLAPVGMVSEAASSQPAPAPTADPILALGLRGTVLPGRLVRALARPLAHFFHPPVIALVAVSLVAADVWLLLTADAVAGLNQLIAEPLLAIPLLLLGLLLAVLHELGHAAGCRYGGGRPGRIGFGVFVVWPAMFTDVTDAYRLSRGARIRTDLGGLYFSLIGILLVIGLYAVSDLDVLVLILIPLHVQAVQQLIPFVRTDGYYLLGDVSGVPNPFSSVAPVLRSALPGRPLDPSIAGMRPGTRRIITVWVLMVVPFLILGLGITLWLLPRALPRWLASIEAYVSDLQGAVAAGNLLPGLYAALSLLLLMVPIAGGLIVLVRVVRVVVRRRHSAHRSTSPSPGRSS